MLKNISWLTYLVSVLSGTLIYYCWVISNFYRREAAGLFKRGRAEPLGVHPLPVPGFPVIGPAAPDEERLVSDQELFFGPGDGDSAEPLPVPSPTGEVSEFAEMVSEIKTLIRVMAESSESRENFDMLFGLIIQKYPALSETPYRAKIIGFLLAESEGVFPFPLHEDELNQIWNEQIKN